MEEVPLTNENFFVFCSKHYNNPQCYDTSEMLEDLKRLKYIKKLLTRYIITHELQERLILNHLIILNNLFGVECLTKMLFLKMEGYMPYIKPFLILLNILPDVVTGIGKDQKRFDTTLIPLDQTIVNKLREL